MRGDISIHAPREGCDSGTSPRAAQYFRFQSTHPVRGATGNTGNTWWNSGISIHAPREGCDGRLWPRQERGQKISIHAPREGCDTYTPTPVDVTVFQSTHPVRGATVSRIATGGR